MRRPTLKCVAVSATNQIMRKDLGGHMKDKRTKKLILIPLALIFLFGAGGVAAEEGDQIVHDAEYYILEVQNGQRWAVEDGELDAKLAELREKYGQPPNIVYILWDDTAFGAVGFPGLQ